ncbi:FK506-binding protein 15-like [Diachasmimorpha longicaudata]|uniref:FK506-binding protein 15-like n=1 Tax=Diachasmimorpha longicaudata TaxID=58733 RepID=UPI0030B88933
MSRSNQLPNLDKLFRDEGEQEFTLQGGSNLAAIFGTPQRLELPSAQKKTSPKPKPPEPSPAASAKTEVILAKVVHAYKLQSSQYSLIGKLGIALAGNSTTHSYLLILYKAKQEHLSVVTVTPDFVYTVRENNYACYYDSAKDNWSILFDTPESSIEFAREVGVAKYFVQTVRPEDSVFSQDLTPSRPDEDTETKKADENDELEVEYSIVPRVTQPLKLPGTPKQSMKIRITSDETWEKSLIGVHQGLKRLLILPPSKQISMGPGYPREQDIAMEIEIMEIIKPEVKTSPKPTSAGKASLILRMAKMGQSMLPKVPTSTTTDSEDTEEEIQVKPRRSRGHVDPPHVKSDTPSPVKSPENQNSKSVVPAFVHPWTPAQQFVSNDGQLYSYQTPVLPQVPADPSINIFLSETRTHNAEIRMAMSKMTDNVQKLLDKFHALELERCTSPMNERSLEGLKILMGLKSDTRSSDSSEDRSAKETGESLSECLRNLEKSERERKAMEMEKVELWDRFQRLEGYLSDSQSALHRSLKDLKDANDLAVKYQKENARLETKIATIETEKISLEKRLGGQGREDGYQVKQIMNKTYQTLVGKFTDDSYSTEYIKSVLGSTIRSITLQMLQERKGEAVGSDAEMRESDGESKIASRGEEKLTLPDVDGTSNQGMNITMASQEEPPPIPPMDLDIENDWLS